MPRARQSRLTRSRAARSPGVRSGSQGGVEATSDSAAGGNDAPSCKPDPLSAALVLRRRPDGAVGTPNGDRVRACEGTGHPRTQGRVSPRSVGAINPRTDQTRPPWCFVALVESEPLAVVDWLHHRRIIGIGPSAGVSQAGALGSANGCSPHDALIEAGAAYGLCPRIQRAADRPGSDHFPGPASRAVPCRGWCRRRRALVLAASRPDRLAQRRIVRKGDDPKPSSRAGRSTRWLPGCPEAAARRAWHHLRGRALGEPWW